MAQWIERARTDLAELEQLASAPTNSPATNMVPFSVRAGLSCCEAVHGLCVFFARPSCFGGGLVLALTLLFGSPPPGGVLGLVIVVCISGLVLWAWDIRIWRTWRAFFHRRYTLKANASANGSTGSRNERIVATVSLTFIVGISFILTVFAYGYELVANGPLPPVFAPQPCDSYVAPPEPSDDPRSGVAARAFAQSDRNPQQVEVLQEYPPAPPKSPSPSRRSEGYSIIVGRVIGAVSICAAFIGWLVSWLNRRRW
jgi:hypothetical protein